MSNSEESSPSQIGTTSPLGEEPDSSQPPTGVQRYRKGRSFADTLFGRMRYGKDLVTNNWVAIKENRRWFATNHISTGGDPVSEDIFREIETMRYLQSRCGDSDDRNDGSQYILRLLDVVEDTAYIYVIFELVNGGEFFNLVQQHHEGLKILRSRHSENHEEVSRIESAWFDRMSRLFRQLAEGVRWLHEQNICHLDLSLENTLLDGQERIRIIDFGLALQYDPIENPSFQTNCGRVGKIGYMAPEVYRQHQFDGRKADCWSLGVMLFMMMSGGPPFSLPRRGDKRFDMIMCGRLRDLTVYWRRTSTLNIGVVDLLCRIFKPERDRLLVSQLFDLEFLVRGGKALHGASDN